MAIRYKFYAKKILLKIKTKCKQRMLDFYQAQILWEQAGLSPDTVAKGGGVMREETQRQPVDGRPEMSRGCWWE